MEPFLRYVRITRKMLICCTFWIFTAAEANIMSEEVGSTVTLPCKNESLSTLTQLTWKMNGNRLFSYRPEGQLHTFLDAKRLNINMSLSEARLFELIVETANVSHTGNYTCQTSTATGALEQIWELVITEAAKEKKLPYTPTLVAVTVPCVCCLIIIVSVTLMKRDFKTHTENTNQNPTAEVQKQPEDIYENCLEIDASQRSVPRHSIIPL